MTARTIKQYNRTMQKIVNHETANDRAKARAPKPTTAQLQRGPQGPHGYTRPAPKAPAPKTPWHVKRTTLVAAKKYNMVVATAELYIKKYEQAMADWNNDHDTLVRQLREANREIEAMQAHDRTQQQQPEPNTGPSVTELLVVVRTLAKLI